MFEVVPMFATIVASQLKACIIHVLVLIMNSEYRIQQLEQVRKELHRDFSKKVNTTAVLGPCVGVLNRVMLCRVITSL